MTRSVLAVFLLLVGFIGMAAALDDSALGEKLVAGSPWNASAVIGGNRGQATFNVLFTRQGDKLGGELRNWSGPVQSPNGPLKSVDVKNGEVEVTSPTGGIWKLKLRDDGSLFGPAYSRDGRVSGDLTMTPTR